ncbi:alpha/beta hydrolase family protein [Nocardia takedensis]|uniref:alpha/beta hydrolase family protein n=1 Tax=Nocardia takedensis TaxID=259390 RepID=UPI003F770803
MPEPTGAETVGVVDLHLVDTSRRDPYRPGDTRELMVSIWYPAADGAREPVRRPWLSPNLARIYTDTLIQVGTSPDKQWTFAPGHGQVDAAANVSSGPRPVVVFSPGMGMPRELSTAHAEDLASHGFVVVTMSHTHESSATEFPDGRIEPSVLPPTPDPAQAQTQIATALTTRVADTRFVLDELADIAGGNNPDQYPLPVDLPRALDMSKVVMFGHSLGGATAAQAMHDDPRILAAANLDGALWGSVLTDGVDRPLMLVSSDGEDRDDVAGWQEFWSHSRGPKFHFRLDRAQHHSFCDNQLIAAPLVTAGILPPAVASQMVGTIDPKVSLDLQNTYLCGFFATTLGRYDQLPQDPATFLHPEMVPVP